MILVLGDNEWSRQVRHDKNLLYIVVDHLMNSDVVIQWLTDAAGIVHNVISSNYLTTLTVKGMNGLIPLVI